MDNINIEDFDPTDPEPRLPEAVYALVGGGGWSAYTEQDGTWVVNWLNEQELPLFTDDEINTKLNQLKGEWTRRKYQRDRRKAFSEKQQGEQFDMMYHDQVNGTTEWVDWVASVKAKYPKP